MAQRSPLKAAHFVEDLLGHGRYSFSRKEAERHLGTSATATYTALHRLIKARRLVMPRSGFYVIVDPRHRAAGTLAPGVRYEAGEAARIVGDRLLALL